jgi:phosphoglycolate phosphatase
VDRGHDIRRLALPRRLALAIGISGAPDDRPAGRPPVTLVCCGLLGTLTADEGLIERSFAEAIATQGVVTGTSAYARRMSQVHQARGLAPGEVLRILFPDNEARAQAAGLAFDRALTDAIRRIPIALQPGAEQVLARLREAGLLVCVTTSLPRRVVDAVLESAGLRRRIDLAVSGDEVPRAFPAPDLVLTAIMRTGTKAVQQVAVVHGTGAGVEGGQRAGASVVAGVLTGPHGAGRLRDNGATHILASIAQLPDVLLAGAVEAVDPVDPASPADPVGPAAPAGPADRAAAPVGGAGASAGAGAGGRTITLDTQVSG